MHPVELGFHHFNRDCRLNRGAALGFQLFGEPGLFGTCCRNCRDIIRILINIAAGFGITKNRNNLDTGVKPEAQMRVSDVEWWPVVAEAGEDALPLVRIADVYVHSLLHGQFVSLAAYSPPAISQPRQRSSVSASVKQRTSATSCRHRRAC